MEEVRAAINLYIAVFYFSAPIAVAIIMRRAGFSPWWGLLILIPGASMVWLWVFALLKWPRERGQQPAGDRS